MNRCEEFRIGDRLRRRLPLPDAGIHDQCCRDSIKREDDPVRTVIVLSHTACGVQAVCHVQCPYRELAEEDAEPSKQLFFRAEAREKIVRGAAALADAVRVTLVPKSKCVLIGKKWGRSPVCNDGVTIAKEVEIKDPEENLGAVANI
jgi:hypothetical protein